MEGVRRCVSTTAPASKSPPISLQTAGAGAGTVRSSIPSHPPYVKVPTWQARLARYIRPYLSNPNCPGLSRILSNFSISHPYLRIITVIKNIIFFSLYLQFRSIPPSLQHLTYRKLQHSSHPSTLANPHPDGQRRRNSDPWYRYRT